MEATEDQFDQLPDDVLIRLNLACNDFEQLWHDGGQPALEDFLESVDAAYHGLWLRELLPLDIEYRRRRGLQVTPQFYRQRFPSASDSLFARLFKTDSPPQDTTGSGRLQSGTRLCDRYRIIESIGRGGMAEVYRATDTKLGRDVAIKVLRHETVSDQNMQDRFDREIRSVAMLSHPNVVKLFDMADDGPLRIAVMELVEGKTLRSLIGDGIDWHTAIGYAQGIAAGLQAAHRCNIMHRDIKPENIIISNAGHAMVLDFGLARPESHEMDQDLTAGVTIPGTVPYMSPEQADGAPLTCATDLFSFGIVLFETLTGVNPFRSDSTWETLRNIKQVKELPSLHAMGLDVPAELEEFLRHLLQRIPSDRPEAASAELVLRRLVTKSLSHKILPEGKTHFSQDVCVAALTNIPLRTAALLGREAEIAECCSRLREHSIVTVLGPGGVGKTSLALAVAESCLDQYPGGVWFCEFAPLSTADDIAEVVASVLEGNAGSIREPTKIIANLTGPPVLLVFDNCEHVIDSAADLAEKLRSRVPNLTILATSRELLDVSGEATIRLDGLSHTGANSDAFRLFSERASEATGVEFSPAQFKLVERIVKRLEGLPLAVELAASRLGTLSLEELHAAMDDQITVLRRRRRSNERQSTIDRAIAWSFDLLNQQEQELLLSLSVFAASFTLEAAFEVSGRRNSGPHELYALVEKSVIHRIEEAGKSRYRLLEPIRQFCRSRVAANAVAAARERHARYYAARTQILGKGISGENEIECTTLLNKEWSDLRQAFAWGRQHKVIEVAVDPIVALARTAYFQVRTEAFQWLESAVAVFGKEAADRADVNFAMGLMNTLTGKFDKAEEFLFQSAEIRPSPQVEWARFLLFISRHRPMEAAESIRRGRLLADVAGDSNEMRWFQNSVHLAVALAYIDPSDPQVDEELRASEEFLSTVDWPTGECGLHGSAAAIAISRNDRSAAVMHIRQAKNIARRCGNRTIESLAGQLASGIDDLELPAIDRLSNAVKYLRSDIETGDASLIPLAVRSVIVGLVDLGHFHVAAQCSAIVDRLIGAGANDELSPRYQPAMAQLQETLGADEFERLRSESENLQVENVIELAEGVLDTS